MREIDVRETEFRKAKKRTTKIGKFWEETRTERRQPEQQGGDANLVFKRNLLASWLRPVGVWASSRWWG